MQRAPAPSIVLSQRRYRAPIVRRQHQVTRRIVLTGGPGGGKSTAVAALGDRYDSHIATLPEAATMLYGAGMPRGEHHDAIRIAQRAIYGTQRSLEVAGMRETPGTTQLCDRGTVDGAAYWPDGPEAFFLAMGTTHERELRRYDVVVFLRSPAGGADHAAAYQQDGSVRTEDAELAQQLDEDVLRLYRSHEHLVVVDSAAEFADKLQQVAGVIDRLLGVSHRGAVQ